MSFGLKMKQSFLPFAVGTSAMLLAACTGLDGANQQTAGSKASSEQPYEQYWACPTGTVFTSTTPEHLTLVYKNQTYRLEPSVAASGAKYQTATEPTITFWSKADEAFFQVGEHVLGPCQLSDPLTEAEETKRVAAEIQSGEWHVQTLNGNQVPEGIMRFQFEEARINGLAACNRFFGSYQLTGKNSIAFSQMGATKMACDAQKMKLETEFFQLLGEAAHISFGEDDSLIIHGSADQVLHAVKKSQ